MKMTKLPEWANWLARDYDGTLAAYQDPPFKYRHMWELNNGDGDFKDIEETDDTFEHIKWTDERPTKIKRGLEAGGVSVEELKELNSITNAKAHGYDEVPETETGTNKDMVNKPNHYIGEYGLEVEDVLRNFIPRYTDPYVGHRIASAIEYLLRSPLKNGQQDIEKARKNLDQALVYVEEKELRNIPSLNNNKLK